MNRILLVMAVLLATVGAVVRAAVGGEGRLDLVVLLVHHEAEQRGEPHLGATRTEVDDQDELAVSIVSWITDVCAHRGRRLATRSCSGQRRQSLLLVEHAGHHHLDELVGLVVHAAPSGQTSGVKRLLCASKPYKAPS